MRPKHCKRVMVVVRQARVASLVPVAGLFSIHPYRAIDSLQVDCTSAASLAVASIQEQGGLLGWHRGTMMQH